MLTSQTLYRSLKVLKKTVQTSKQTMRHENKNKGEDYIKIKYLQDFFEAGDMLIVCILRRFRLPENT